MKNTKPSSPCYKCEERRPKCHSVCERYRSFRADLDEWNKKNKKAFDIEQIMDQYEFKKGRKGR